MRMRQVVLVGIVLAAVVGAAFAVREEPAALNAADDVVTSRYRMAVVRVDLAADSAGEPLSLTEFGDAGAARKPLAPAAAAAGQFASVVHSTCHSCFWGSQMRSRAQDESAPGQTVSVPEVQGE